MRRTLLSVLLIGLIALLTNFAGAEPTESQGFKATKEKLKQKVTLDLDNTPLRDIIEELKGSLKGGTLRIKPAPNQGITLTSRFTVKVKDESLESVLDKLLKEKTWGYYIQNGPANSQDDGAIILVNKPWRGSQEDDDGKTKKDDKKKEVAKKDDEPKKKDAPSDDEKAATKRLDLAENYIAAGKNAKAVEIIEDLIKKYPETQSAAKGKKLLEKIKK